MKNVRRLLCVDGPHIGEWHDVDWLCETIILVKPSPPADIEYPSVAMAAALSFPCPTNIRRALAEMIIKTTYAVCGRSLRMVSRHD